MEEAAKCGEAERPQRLEVKNLGEPIRLAEINVHGVMGEAKPAGQSTGTMWSRFVFTSDQAIFHRIVGNLASVIEYSAQQAGTHVKLDRYGVVLLVMHPNNTGELWLDAAAMMTETTLKRPGPLAAGTVLFENDIADVRGVWFPLVDIGPKDRILCILREGWRFGVLFDGNGDGELSIDAAKRDLGRLYRSMKYADLYGAMSHEPTLAGLVAKGWFPFLELMSGEFGKLLSTLEAGFDLDGEEENLVAKFDEARLERMFSRWMERNHLKEKEPILRSAINAYKTRTLFP